MHTFSILFTILKINMGMELYKYSSLSKQERVWKLLFHYIQTIREMDESHYGHNKNYQLLHESITSLSSLHGSEH
jgi:hypothetical protein